MKFEVVIEATSDGTLTPLPPVLSLRLTRLTTGERVDLTAILEPGLTPKYRVTWDITHLKARWSIVTRDYPSNTASFKIDKRSRIVQLANSWVSAAQYHFDETPPKPEGYHGGEYCDDLARYVYSYVGVGVAGGSNNVAALYGSMNTTIPDVQAGSIWFYPSAATGAWQHNGINIGGAQTVDQNCGHPHSLGQLPIVGTHAANDTNLVNPQKYSAPTAFSTTELQQLDTE